MDGNVVSAAKWFGCCLVVSVVVLVVGLFVIADRCSRRMSSAVSDIGRGSPVVTIPSSFSISHSTNSPIRLDLSPNNETINLKVTAEEIPLRMTAQEHNVYVQTPNPLLYKNSP